MKRDTNELYFQLVALLLGIIIVHSVFVTVAAGGDYVVPRSFFIIIKDLEQESCFILLFWAAAIMAYKTRAALREQAMFEQPLISIDEGSRVLVEDASQLARPLEALPDQKRSLLLPRTLQAALTRFQVTASIQSANDAVNTLCGAEGERLDSELSMIRYITWAIPSIGFIGTVRGIGAALGQAHEAIQGDIAGVTSSLGVAFNSTFVALLISMFVMFFMHQLQLIQERLVLDSQAYCENNLLRFLKT